MQLNSIYSEGKKVERKYVRLPVHLKQGFVCKNSVMYFTDLLYSVFRHTIRIEDANSSLIGLIVHDNSGWLKRELNNVFQHLKLLMPRSMTRHKHGRKKPNFKSIHFDIWNRYHEKVFFLLNISSILIIYYMLRETMLHEMLIPITYPKKMSPESTFRSASLTSLTLSGEILTLFKL
jgi:hypothetical protein